MKKELDHFDHKIIRALTDDARISITKLSSIVNLSRNAINYRIKKLETIGMTINKTIAKAVGKINQKNVL